MFGTNFPQLTWDACVKSANKDIKLRDDVKADFFGGNAARVLKLDMKRSSTKEKLWQSIYNTKQRFPTHYKEVNQYWKEIFMEPFNI